MYNQDSGTALCPQLLPGAWSAAQSRGATLGYRRRKMPYIQGAK